MRENELQEKELLALTLKKPFVVGLSATFRSKYKGNADDFLQGVGGEAEFRAKVKEWNKAQKLSNTDAIVMCSVFGARLVGAESEFVSLREYFPDFEPSEPTKENTEKLLALLRRADGVVIGSPVYFGDRSSYVYSLLNLVRDYGSDFFPNASAPFAGKVFGVDSVGAKRNGGQETTNIFTLYDCMQLGAIVVGNGPPTSQYGGTGWAGDIGAMADDDFGIETSIGTGKRVGEIARFLKNAESASELKKKIEAKKQRNKILFVITCTGGNLEARTRALAEQAKKTAVVPFDYEFLHLPKFVIKRCVGHAAQACPNPTLFGKPCYNCHLADDMHKIHETLLGADALVLCDYPQFNEKGNLDMYQTFFERTRYLRHDNFKFSNIPLAAITFEKQDNNSVFPLRAITSLLRHNGVLLGPTPIVREYEGKQFGFEHAADLIAHTAESAATINSGRTSVGEIKAEYLAIGFGELAKRK